MKIRAFAILFAVLILVIVVVLVLQRTKEFLYAGTVEATEVVISSRLTAVIDAVNVQEGSKVKAGAELVRLSVEDIRIAYEASERDYQRAVSLLKAGSLNREAFDKIRSTRDANLVRLNWSIITSPLDATVLSRYREPGEMVNPGTRLLMLADLCNVWAYVYVPQPMLSQISLNMQVPCVIPESDGKTITGTIVHINDEAEFTPKNVQTRQERTRLVYGVKIAFNNSEGLLKPGMTIEARLPRQTK